MQSINLLVPDEIILEISEFRKPDVTLNDRLQLSLAIGMFMSQEISLAKAAQLARINLDEFMDVLISIGIPSFHYTEAMLTDDMKFASMI